MPSGKTCPICGTPPDARHRPFCSKRCADIDLGRWFNESYVVPQPIDPETVDIERSQDDETIH